MTRGTVHTRYKTPVATEARRLYAGGFSIREVCAQLAAKHVPSPGFNTVYRWLRVRGEQRTKQEAAMVRCGNRERYVQAIMLRVGLGLSTSEIARRLAWNPHSVRKVLRDAGVGHRAGEGRAAAWAEWWRRREGVAA